MASPAPGTYSRESTVRFLEDPCNARGMHLSQKPGRGPVSLTGGWLTGPEAMLESEVAVPLDDWKREHVSVAADEPQRERSAEQCPVYPEPCRPSAAPLRHDRSLRNK